MFTGLVEEVGECRLLRRAESAIQLAILAPEISAEIHIGDSVSVNGACLTVASLRAEELDFDLLEETLLGRCTLFVEERS
jgi:riboflavin synthase